jgi:hypothetical protein
LGSSRSSTPALCPLHVRALFDFGRADPTLTVHLHHLTRCTVICATWLRHTDTAGGRDDLRTHRRSKEHPVIRDLIASKDHSSEGGSRRGKRLIPLGMIGAAAVLASVVAGGGVASADAGSTASANTNASVTVDPEISFGGITDGFNLEGLPGANVEQNNAVNMNVVTNNLAGYDVTVQSMSPALQPSLSGNPDTIPLSDLLVSGDSSNGFQPLTGSVLVHTQDQRSAEAGDALSNDYEVNVPFVNQDTYSTTLNYIATTL